MFTRSGISTRIGSTGTSCSPNTSTSFLNEWNSSPSSQEGTGGRLSFTRHPSSSPRFPKSSPTSYPTSLDAEAACLVLPRAPATAQAPSPRGPLILSESGSYPRSSRPTSAVIDGMVVSSTLLDVFPVEDVLAHAFSEACVSADLALA
ncbi:hypothetical protein ISCGN_014112 [Ixodes scapularis]